MFIVFIEHYLQVPRNSATDARKPTQKDMKKSARH